MHVAKKLIFMFLHLSGDWPPKTESIGLTLLLLFLLLLTRVPRGLEGCPSEHQHILGVSHEDSMWDEGGPKVRCQWKLKFKDLWRQYFSVCGSYRNCVCIGSAAGSNIWTYALGSDVCPDRRRDGTRASTRFEVALQSDLQKKFLYIKAK